MKNSELPDPSTLLPGTARFMDHPGFDAQDCHLREVVVAHTMATTNGFRCAFTGGHCLPAHYCEARRAWSPE